MKWLQAPRAPGKGKELSPTSKLGFGKFRSRETGPQRSCRPGRSVQRDQEAGAEGVGSTSGERAAAWREGEKWRVRKRRVEGMTGVKGGKRRSGGDQGCGCEGGPEQERAARGGAVHDRCAEGGEEARGMVARGGVERGPPWERRMPRRRQRRREKEAAQDKRGKGRWEGARRGAGR